MCVQKFRGIDLTMRGINKVLIQSCNAWMKVYAPIILLLKEWQSMNIYVWTAPNIDNLFGRLQPAAALASAAADEHRAAVPEVLRLNPPGSCCLIANSSNYKSSETRKHLSLNKKQRDDGWINLPILPILNWRRGVLLDLLRCSASTLSGLFAWSFERLST